MRILKADHREAEKLLDKLAESEEGAERQQMVDELTMKLTAHMDLEESIVYPSVRETVGEEDEEEAEVEHRLAREGLDTLNSLVDVPGFGAAVEMLKGGILHHVKEEENELLPELKDASARSNGPPWATPLPPPRRSSACLSRSRRTAARRSAAQRPRAVETDRREPLQLTSRLGNEQRWAVGKPPDCRHQHRIGGAPAWRAADRQHLETSTELLQPAHHQPTTLDRTSGRRRFGMSGADVECQTVGAKTQLWRHPQQAQRLLCRRVGGRSPMRARCTAT